MHRRQYLPGSRDGIKLNRGRLADENRALKDRIIRQQEADELAREDKQRADDERQTTGIRGFVNKVKRVLKTPIRMGVR